MNQIGLFAVFIMLIMNAGVLVTADLSYKCEKTRLYLQNYQQQSVKQLKEAEALLTKQKAIERIQIQQKFVDVLGSQLVKLHQRCPVDTYEAFVDYYQQLNRQIQIEKNGLEELK